MATISFTVSDAVLARVIDALCYNWGYQENITNPSTGQLEPNPVSRAQFAKNVIKALIKEEVVRYESDVVRREGNNLITAAVEKAKSEIIIGN